MSDFPRPPRDDEAREALAWALRRIEEPAPGEVAALVEEARRLDAAATPGPWTLHIVGPDDRQTWMIWGAPGSGGWKRAPAAPLSVAEMRAPGHEKGRANWELMTRARTLVPEMAATLESQAREMEDQARDLDDMGVQLASVETERDAARDLAAFHEGQSKIRGERLNEIGEAIGYGPGWEGLAIEAGAIADELKTLRADIEEHLPAYVLVDGSGDEANPRERVEYVGVEIKRLRARLAEVERERDEYRCGLSQTIRERDEARVRHGHSRELADRYADELSTIQKAAAERLIRAIEAEKERDAAHALLDREGVPRLIGVTAKPGEFPDDPIERRMAWLLRRWREATMIDAEDVRPENLRQWIQDLADGSDAANARAEKAEKALAKVAERMAMATRFDMGDGVTIERVSDSWYVHRDGDPDESPSGDMLATDGEWQINLGDCYIPAHRFPDVDAALAALAVFRG